MLGLIAGAIALLFVGFAGGWSIKGWKAGAEIALVNSQKAALESRNSILETANGNCAMDIEGVRNGVAVITDAVAEREKAASDAMRAAQVTIAQHSARAKAIKELPPVPASIQPANQGGARGGYKSARSPVRQYLLERETGIPD